ncbi:MAG: DUF971 domain-containing protein [Pseudomonadota bacterium]
MTSDTPWPIDIVLKKDRRTLEITSDDGVTRSYSAEFLRVLSPSAEVKGHGSAPRQLVSGKRDVEITGIDPIGNYAVRLTFADGHNTGIYSWQYFSELDADREALWSTYLADLEAAGLTRGV